MTFGEFLSASSIVAIRRCNETKRIRKKGDSYISIREAGIMLGIAMFAVWQYFDWGILTGEERLLTLVIFHRISPIPG